MDCMMIYENLYFVSHAKFCDWSFVAKENFAHEWTLYAVTKDKDGISYKKYIADAMSLDELKIWVDLHMPNISLSEQLSYHD